MVMIMMVLSTVSNLIRHVTGYLSILQSFVCFVCCVMAVPYRELIFWTKHV